jgi:general secretion pathway protein H
MSRIGDTVRAQRGFTLIEVTVVLVIIALVTALVMPQMSGVQSKADMRAAARGIAAGLRMTRNLAMTHGRSEAFVIDTASGAFRAGSVASPRRVPSGVHLVLMTTTDERIDDAVGSIQFFADGSSSGGGVRVAKGKNQGEVLVDWLTGQVSIEDAVNGSTR